MFNKKKQEIKKKTQNFLNILKYNYLMKIMAGI